MGRSSRIVFLTITAILAIFVFVAMWVVKPSGNSNVLTAARERQNTPLVSVEKPLETDIKTLSQEEEFEQKVRKLLAEDPDFLEKLTQSIKASLQPICRCKLFTCFTDYFTGMVYIKPKPIFHFY